jgi:hypothetical protein
MVVLPQPIGPIRMSTIDFLPTVYSVPRPAVILTRRLAKESTIKETYASENLPPPLFAKEG